MIPPGDVTWNGSPSNIAGAGPTRANPIKQTGRSTNGISTFCAFTRLNRRAENPSEDHLMSRLTLAALCLITPALTAAPIDPSAAKADGDTLWYDVRSLGVEGQGWKDVKAPFDRLPAKAEEMVRKEVWGLSRHSAGLCVRFVTDAA